MLATSGLHKELAILGFHKVLATSGLHKELATSGLHKLVTSWPLLGASYFRLSQGAGYF